MKYTCDVAIIGGGLAAYRAAVSAAESSAKVVLVDKGGSSSPFIMGFNAPVNSGDSTELFYQDLLDSSCASGSLKLKKKLAAGSVEQFKYLEAQGLVFDRDPEGTVNSIGVLGCSVPRLVHIGGNTGSTLLAFLKKKAEAMNVTILSGTVCGLSVSDGVFCGLSGFSEKQDPFIVSAKSAVIACGGNGGLFRGSTYPDAILGDGYSLALQAGAKLVDMEFQQFEPCCFAFPESIRGKLAVTTMLLKGGCLKNRLGDPFMITNGKGYKIQKNELAACIMKEVREGRGTQHGGVLYDVTGVEPECVTGENGIFYNIALSGGIDLLKEPAEVAPAPHTEIGGILINEKCETNVDGLYAAGESAGGIHGANRIGGCAGSETLVFGAEAGMQAAMYAANHSCQEHERDFCPGDFILNRDARSKLKDAASEWLSYDKSESSLQKGIQWIREEKTTGSAAWKMTLQSVEAMLLSSLLREESRGVFHRTDRPETVRKYDFQSNVVFLENGVLKNETIDFRKEE